MLLREPRLPLPTNYIETLLFDASDFWTALPIASGKPVEALPWSSKRCETVRANFQPDIRVQGLDWIPEGPFPSFKV
jgi:hypothetical protein